MAVCITTLLRLFAASLVVFLSVAWPIAANAQVAIGGALGLSMRRDGADDQPYLGPGFGGTSVGYVVMLDVDMSPAVSIGGELSKAGDITATQQQRVSGGANTLLSKHHDTIMYGVVKLRPRALTRYHLAPVAGLGFARRQTERSGTFTSSRPPFGTSPVSETTLSDTVLAVTGGVDSVFPFGLGRHAAIVALARVHYLADKDRTPEFVVRRGVSSIIFRCGIGAQFQF